MAVNYVNAEHVHTVIDLPTDKSAENCVKLYKGASSDYINQEKLTQGKFNWGRGYAAFSVCESVIDKVIEYIKNQKEHHRVKSFTEEYNAFIKKYKLNTPITDME
jgi:putative transposase